MYGFITHIKRMIPWLAQSSKYSINVTFLPSNGATTWKPLQNSKDWTIIVDCHGSEPPSGMICSTSSIQFIFSILLPPLFAPFYMSSPWYREQWGTPSCPSVPKTLDFDSLTRMSQNYVQILVYNHKVHYLWVHLRTQCIWLQILLYFNSQKFLKDSSKIPLLSARPQFHLFFCIFLLASHSFCQSPRSCSTLKSVFLLDSTSLLFPEVLSPHLI